MDITLQRILLLIPKKPNGQYIHGAKTKFAQSIGLSSGNSIAEWEAGRSTSYKNYLFEISAKYNVSVEWLRGETEEKTPTTGNGDGLTDDEIAILALFRQLTPDMKRVLKAQLSALVQSQNDLGDPVKTE